MTGENPFAAHVQNEAIRGHVYELLHKALERKQETSGAH